MAKNDDGESDIPLLLERLARLMRAGEFGGSLNPAQWEAMRYLARANRFSNSPGAVARFAGATKGTISQTLKSLLAKGYLAKVERPGERRSIALSLTETGTALLASDPWQRFAEACDALGGKTRRRMAKGLQELLTHELEARGHRPFGPCGPCRFFRPDQRPETPESPHLCMFFDAALSDAETKRLCVAHQPRH